MRVLIMDDDAQIRALLRQVVEISGHEVLEAENGKTGMALQRQWRASLVITDIIMLEQEGLETIGVLRREFPGTKIIAVSGGGRVGPEAYLPVAQDLGADRIFTKPFKVDEILQAIQELAATDAPRTDLAVTG
ncbi:MAG: response regulator [Desulfobulbaceae bacterium A2]|nr:MAG: response regulator [Desulfobulbaceae bacterium A2]